MKCRHSYQYLSSGRVKHRWETVYTCRHCGHAKKQSILRPQEASERQRIQRERRLARKALRTPANKQRKPIQKVSQSMKSKLKEYKVLREAFLAENPICQVDGCSSQSTECHHKRGRGKYLLDVSTFLACCSLDHQRIHHNPKWAEEHFYLLPRNK